MARPIAGPYKPPRLVRTGGSKNCQELNFLELAIGRGE
jgi:hypothetical protein